MIVSNLFLDSAFNLIASSYLTNLSINFWDFSIYLLLKVSNSHYDFSTLNLWIIVWFSTVIYVIGIVVLSSCLYWINLLTSTSLVSSLVISNPVISTGIMLVNFNYKLILGLVILVLSLTLSQI